MVENFVKKIEIQWQNILAMRAIIEENTSGILQIELDKPPAFFHEVTPMPRKRTSWILSQDFTGGQASKHRRHYLHFPPGVLEKHYEKLIQYDNRLLQLSGGPFPSLQFRPYFDSQLYQGPTDLSIDQNLHRSKTTPAPVDVVLPGVSTQVQQFGNTMPWSSNGMNDSTSPTSGIRSPPNEAINNERLQEPGNQGLDDCYIVLAMDSLSLH